MIRMVIAVLMSAGIATPVWAADWQLSRQLGTEIVYTDNLFPTATTTTSSAEKTAKKAAAILTLTPGIVLTKQGRFVELDFAYSAQFLHYSTEQVSDAVQHHLQMNNHNELIADHLFLDAAATVGQSQMDTLAPSGRDASTPNNTQTMYTYTITPAYRSRLGRWAELALEWGMDGVLYGDATGNENAIETTGLTQSTANTDTIAYHRNAELRSGTALVDTSIGIRWTDEYQQDTDDRLQSVQLFSGHQFSAMWRYDGHIGYEDNQYATAAAADETSGMQWQLTATWTPNERTSFKLGLDGHYFGVAPLLEWSYRRRHSVWSASFARTLTTGHNEKLRAAAFQFTDSFGNKTTPKTYDTALLKTNNMESDETVFIADNLTAGYALQFGRNTVDVNLSYTRHEYTTTQPENETWGGGIGWSRRVNTKTTVSAAIDWEQMDALATSVLTQNTGEQQRNDKRSTSNIELGITRQLTRQTGLGLFYNLREDADYTENRVTLGLQSQWDH